MNIREIAEIAGRAAYEVLSDSGKTYTVRYMGCGDDPDMMRLWDCNCPAGTHGKMCRHVRAVIESIDD